MRIDDPTDYSSAVDNYDLFIVKELQKNGRATLASLAFTMGITVPGAKYHYDKIVSRGVCKHYLIDIFPYPIELAAVYDVMLDFPSRERMNRFLSGTKRLFFFINVTKVMGKNSLLLRAYVPEMQVSNMFTFLSELTKKKMFTSYSALRLRFETRASQTISYELFDENKGWTFNYSNCTEKLKRLSA